jgi:hypothetical protein
MIPGVLQVQHGEIFSTRLLIFSKLSFRKERVNSVIVPACILGEKVEAVKKFRGAGSGEALPSPEGGKHLLAKKALVSS